ncbi:hypothetical protein I3843_05G108700 [Carya illinoinensis]|nr:hypothetical protein I3843_05G108700 [Carya illinoinensis]
MAGTHFKQLHAPLAILLLGLLLQPCFIVQASAECRSKEKSFRGCHDEAEALKLKLIAIFSILVTSMIGVCLPLFSRAVPALRPDRDLFALVKAFASGVILATGYMHVLPDSFNNLTSDCLPETPWRKFPFATFVAMLSALLTLMVDSVALSHYKKRFAHELATGNGEQANQGTVEILEHVGHGHDKSGKDPPEDGTQLLSHRVVAQVLEMGIVVHSVVIGLSMGASDNPCTIRPLIAALCFHQLFEGMGLGGCILQAEYGIKMKEVMVFFFSITTPFGISLGIGLSNIYSAKSQTALIVEGVLNAASAGLLNYMALVDLLASDFMGSRLQNSLKLQIWSFIAVLLGAGGMSLMAKWA